MITKKQKQSLRIGLARMIKERRISAGISQYKLAEILGTTQNRIPELERGDTKNIETYINCINALGGQLKIEWE